MVVRKKYVNVPRKCQNEFIFYKLKQVSCLFLLGDRFPVQFRYFKFVDTNLVATVTNRAKSVTFKRNLVK